MYNLQCSVVCALHVYSGIICVISVMFAHQPIGHVICVGCSSVSKYLSASVISTFTDEEQTALVKDPVRTAL